MRGGREGRGRERREEGLSASVMTERESQHVYWRDDGGREREGDGGREER